MSVDPAAIEHFGPYLVYERLGVGGMATVHRALEHHDDGSDRIVALKRLLPHLAEDGSFIKSFVREAKLASLLDHVNIVHLYELGRVGTEYFISMEYIDGRDLRRMLRHARRVTGPPPLDVTVGLMIQLCEALDYAHNRVDDDGRPLGLVHRDISPSNLIVTSGGILKIIDFGIAKAQSSQLRTQTGRVKGKLAYMAPEAVSGSRDLDARSDIWATGVILHELSTARPLFASKNDYQTLLKVQRGDIMPPSTFNQRCPPELDAIVFRALARDPDERFASAAALREELAMLAVQYSLKTSYGDIARWLEWAFGIETPELFASETSSGQTSHLHARTPLPPRDQEEEDAVEVVWGGGHSESDGGPIVLAEVPDVSGKHRGRRDSGELADDIPTPLPSHGTMPSVYGDAVHADADDEARSRPDPRPDPRPKRATAQGLAPDSPQLGDRLAAQRVRDAAEMSRHEASRNPVADDSLSLEAPTVFARAKPGGGSNDLGAGDSAAESLGDVVTNPRVAPLREEDVFGVDAAAVLKSVSADIELAATRAMGQFSEDPVTTPKGRAAPELPSVPKIRFSRGNTVPPIEAELGASPNPVLAAPIGAGAPAGPMTKPGLAVGPLVRPAPRSPPHASSPPAIHPAAASDRLPITASPRKKTWLYVVGAAVLAAATATIVALSMSHEKPAPAPVAVPAAPAPGKVKLEVEPTGATIEIDGKPTLAGTSTELAAGAYTVEIHRPGYKSWKTALELSAGETAFMRVVLEPMVAPTEDATLAVATTPPGLDVYIDGVLFPAKSPIKTTMKVGTHVIAVRQNDVEVWRTTIAAEAASDYELNPSFTDVKKRERAQRSRRSQPSEQSEQSERSGQRPATKTTPAAAPTPIQPPIDPSVRPTVPAPDRPPPERVD